MKNMTRPAATSTAEVTRRETAEKRDPNEAEISLV